MPCHKFNPRVATGAVRRGYGREDEIAFSVRGRLVVNRQGGFKGRVSEPNGLVQLCTM